MLVRQFWIYRKHSCLIFIIIISERNLETKLNYYLQILAVKCILYKQKIFIKTSIKISRESLIHLIILKNIHQELKRINKKVIGKFKDEAAGKQITHFVGLRPKLYSFKVEDDPETRKAKGVKKNVIKKTLSFEDYKECLFSEEKVMKDMNIIRSKNHDIFSMTMNKLALSPNDDKRLICENKINTKALR